MKAVSITVFFSILVVAGTKSSLLSASSETEDPFLGHSWVHPCCAVLHCTALSFGPLVDQSLSRQKTCHLLSDSGLGFSPVSCLPRAVLAQVLLPCVVLHLALSGLLRWPEQTPRHASAAMRRNRDFNWARLYHSLPGRLKPRSSSLRSASSGLQIRVARSPVNATQLQSKRQGLPMAVGTCDPCTCECSRQTGRHPALWRIESTDTDTASDVGESATIASIGAVTNCVATGDSTVASHT